MKYEICIIYRDEITTVDNVDHYYIEDSCFFMEINKEQFGVKIVPLNSVIRIEIQHNK